MCLYFLFLTLLEIKFQYLSSYTYWKILGWLIFWNYFEFARTHNLIFLCILLDLIATFPNGPALQGHIVVTSTLCTKKWRDSIHYCWCPSLERQIMEGIFSDFSPTMYTSLIQNKTPSRSPSFQTGPASAECWVILQHTQVFSFLSSKVLLPVDLFEFNVMFKHTAFFRAFQ